MHKACFVSRLVPASQRYNRKCRLLEKQVLPYVQTWSICKRLRKACKANVEKQAASGRQDVVLRFKFDTMAYGSVMFQEVSKPLVTAVITYNSFPIPSMYGLFT